MKKVILLLFIIGDCVQITTGLLENQIYRVTEVTANSTYTLYDGGWTVEAVPERFLKPVDKKYCEAIQ